MKKQSYKKSTTKSYTKLIISVLVVCLLGTLIWKYAAPTPTPIGINEVANVSTGTVDLALTPSSLSIAPGAEQNIDLKIDAGSTKVTAIEVVLAYDPAIIGTPTVTQGSFLSNTLSSPKVGDGKITFTYAVSPDIGGQDGSGILATIKIKPVATGNTVISFVEDTVAVASNQPADDNIIKSATGAQITLSSATSTDTINAVSQTQVDSPPSQLNTSTMIVTSQPSTTTPAPARKTPTSQVTPQVTTGTTTTTTQYSPPTNTDSYIPQTTTSIDDSSSEVPVADYPYTQAELDKKFDLANNLSIWQKIVNFINNIFGAKTK